MRVLVVDDERTSLLIMRMFVELLGGEAVTFSDPEAALAEASRTTFDVAVLDVHMPKLDGIGLAECLRQFAPGIPIIMTSIDDGSAVRRAAFNAGASDFMTKPIERQEFDARLRRILEALAHKRRSSAHPLRSNRPDFRGTD